MYKKCNKIVHLLFKSLAIRGVSPEYPNTDNPTGVIGMMRCMRLLPVFLVTVVALILGVAVLVSCKDGGAQVIQIPFDDARIIIELNATDGDVGIQVFLDGEAWNEVTIVSPDGMIFEVKGEGSLKELGLTELFFESNEPSFDELPLEEFLALFPEGEYSFIGKTVEGDELVGTATFTHNIPAGPEIVSPAEGAVLDPDMPVVIEWDPVTDPFPGTDSEGIEIVRYQVIVEREEPQPLLVFSVDLPASASQVTVSPEFIEPGTAYKFEVLAIEAGGNQTISESFFCTDPLTPCPEPQ